MTSCRHCGRTSHGMACCGMLAAEAGHLCPIDHRPTTDPESQNRPYGPPTPVETTTGRPYGPQRPVRAARSITPRGRAPISSMPTPRPRKDDG